MHTRLNCSYATWADNAPPKSQLPNKSSSTGHEKPPTQVVSQGNQATPKTMKAIDIALGHLSKVEDKSQG